jgi:hypothetical protein
MTQAALRKAKENHWEFTNEKPIYTLTQKNDILKL